MDADLPVIQGYSEAARQEMVREFLSGDTQPVCVLCGEEVLVRMSCPPRGQARIEMECPKCRESFVWSPPPPGRWEPLHLAYFLERRRLDADLRCPYDDCRVLTVEYSDGTVLFRCPYCSREAAVAAASAVTGRLLDTQGAGKL